MLLLTLEQGKEERERDSGGDSNKHAATMNYNGGLQEQ